MFQGHEDLFHFERDKTNFEDLGHQNGVRYWQAVDLMRMLGYSDYALFVEVIQKAIAFCNALQIETSKNFQFYNSEYRLTKFACYLIARLADSSKKEVEKARVYFATVSKSFHHFINMTQPEARIGDDDIEIYQSKKLLDLFNMSHLDLKSSKSGSKSLSFRFDV